MTALTGANVPGSYNVTVAVYSGHNLCYKITLENKSNESISLTMFVPRCVKIISQKGDELVLLVVPENGSAIEVSHFGNTVANLDICMF